MAKSEKTDIAKGLVKMLGSQKNKLLVEMLMELSLKVKRNPHNDPTTATYLPNQNENLYPQKDLCEHVHSKFIHNSSKVVSIHR